MTGIARGVAENAARRNALVLATAQAVVGSAGPIAISIGGLAGFWLLAADKSFATLPVTGYNLGVALGAIPAAALMRAVGRRHGFVAGSLVMSAGALCAAMALFQQSFWLFALSLLTVGVGGSFTQQYRFAAADGAPRTYQPRAIAIVLAGGIFAAVIGPQAVRFTDGLFFPVEFAGAFFALAVLGLVGAAVLSFLRVPAASSEDPVADAVPPRPLAQIARQPRFLVGLLCGVGTYATMSFVMTGAPLAMVGCGLSRDVSVLGIQWHVLAMFGPSFFTGRLIARFGKTRIVAAGMLLLAASAAVSLSGLAIWNFWLGLVLLGLGWNFGFIGATAMVAETYRPSERNKTQGLHDMVLFGCVAAASLLSGRIYVAAGWETMNFVVFPVVATCLAALALEALRGRRVAAKG
ncbi:MAG: MFS transporter [Aurantimonas endophytica]|uniref:MFS family permease n=1 Tax=Aurantimonas endophytica TaxID=1522175 RepID=A0A7W6H9M7_9HYPH|nr:MFS transporter [Aurantimonas endophytica]MBB4001077.1 MFS family permease [Aurantimonas endophytica]MCO6403267.1 MFS transporter [Aurantimonas endophytica]